MTSRQVCRSLFLTFLGLFFVCTGSFAQNRTTKVSVATDAAGNETATLEIELLGASFLFSDPCARSAALCR